MAERPKESVEIDDWLGLVDSAGPRALPAGAARVQENLAVVKQGELRVRQGFAPVTFEE